MGEMGDEGKEERERDTVDYLLACTVLYSTLSHQQTHALALAKCSSSQLTQPGKNAVTKGGEGYRRRLLVKQRANDGGND